MGREEGRERKNEREEGGRRRERKEERVEGGRRSERKEERVEGGRRGERKEEREEVRRSQGRVVVIHTRISSCYYPHMFCGGGPKSSGSYHGYLSPREKQKYHGKSAYRESSIPQYTIVYQYTRIILQYTTVYHGILQYTIVYHSIP